jgi:hypothetical protein
MFLSEFCCWTILMHFLLLIYGKFTRAQLAHQIFLLGIETKRVVPWSKNLTVVTLHSNFTFRVFATEAFRKTTILVSSSKNLSKTSGFEPKLRVFVPKLRVFEPKLRGFENWSIVLLNQSCSFCKEFFFVLPKLWAYQMMPYHNPYEVSVERKPEKFPKFRAKINYCVVFGKDVYR